MRSVSSGWQGREQDDKAERKTSASRTQTFSTSGNFRQNVHHLPPQPPEAILMSAPIVPQYNRLFERPGCILSWQWDVCSVFCSAYRQGPKGFCSSFKVTSKIFKLKLGRDQIFTKLNPCASFRVKAYTITVFADVRKSICSLDSISEDDLISL